MALAREGVDLVINARTAATLEATAAAIRAETGVSVTAVAADITTVRPSSWLAKTLAINDAKSKLEKRLDCNCVINFASGKSIVLP